MKTIKVVNTNTDEIIKETVKVLRDGGLVIYPSDTVYVTAVDATNEKAVEKLISFKNRPAGKPISVFVDDFEMLEENVETDKVQKDTLRQLFPGPFTAVLPSRHKISRLLESEKGTLGVRIPDKKSVTELVRKFGKPVTATSANVSGKSPHYSIESLFNEISGVKKSLIDLVIDAGQLPFNKPSTVVDLTVPKLKIVRQGDILFKDIHTFISQTPSQTKKIASHILKKIMQKYKDRTLTFVIEGELGVGKTIFVKGVGEFFGVENIVSPTFVVYYEYNLKNSTYKNLYHFDLYQIEEAEEFEHLGIEKILNGKNIICIEWGEKAGEIIDILKRKSEIVYVKMKYSNEKTREILINF